jgi:hypothetical protein
MDNLGYVAIASVILSVFLVVSWIVLPPSRTHRHYLSLGLISSIGLIAVRPMLVYQVPTLTNEKVQLSFVIPIASTPEKCYDRITPVDMYNSKSCAFTGIFFVVGCLGTEAWREQDYHIPLDSGTV